MTSNAPHQAEPTDQAIMDATNWAGGFKWWCLVAVGLCFFVTLPFLAVVLRKQLTELQMGLKAKQSFDFGKHPHLWSLLIGGISSVPISQYCMTGIVMALHWRRAWQRIAMGLAVAGLSYGVAVAASSDHSRNSSAAEMLFIFVRPAPIAVAATISIVLVFLVRTRFRWVIGIRGRSYHPRPTTLAFCFAVLSSCGIAMALLKLSDLSRAESYGPTTADISIQFLMFVGSPATIASLLSLVLLPGILLESQGSWKTWTQRLVAMVLVVFINLGLFWALASSMPLTNAKLSFDAFIATFAMFVGSSVAALAIAAGSFLWLRLLGYELTTGRSPVV